VFMEGCRGGGREELCRVKVGVGGATRELKLHAAWTSGDGSGRGWYCLRARRRPGPLCHPRNSHGVAHRISDIRRQFITCQMHDANMLN
jgi:hypothetical protein